MFRSLRQHPFLLINGAANTVYYFAESMLYREPLGLVLLVVSSLSATVFFKPVGSIFHLPNSHISPGVLVMGIEGALLCVVEKVSFKARGGGGEGGAGDAGSDAAPGTALDVCVSSFETSGGSMVDRPPSPPRGFAGFTDAMGVRWVCLVVCVSAVLTWCDCACVVVVSMDARHGRRMHGCLPSTAVWM